MRFVVGVVAVAALVVAVVEGGDDSRMTRTKKYKVCTQRDINMLISQLCSGNLPLRRQWGHHKYQPARPGIMTIRVPPRSVRGPVGYPAEIGSSLEFPSFRENLDSQRNSPSDLDFVNDSPDLRPVSYWEDQDRNDYQDSSVETEVPSEFYANALNPRSKKWWYGQWSAADPNSQMYGHRQKKALTFGDIRLRCCTDGCYASELQSLCVL